MELYNENHMNLENPVLSNPGLTNKTKTSDSNLFNKVVKIKADITQNINFYNK